MTELQGNYNIPLVLLSLFISFFASYCALYIYERVLILHGRSRLIWIVFGSAIMGLGIWSMHFIGILAYNLPADVHYNPFWLLTSMLLPIIAVLAAFWMISVDFMKTSSLLMGSLWMGFAIVAMHFTGMAAMDMPFQQHYNGWMVGLSVMIAWSASFAALKISARHRHQEQTISRKAKLLMSLLLGSAIAGMHYTGMSALHIHNMYPLPVEHPVQETNEYTLAIMIGGAMLLILVLLMISQILDKRFAFRQAQINQRRYDSIFEHNPDVVLLFNRSGELLRANPAAEKIMGYTMDELKRVSFTDMIIEPYNDMIRDSFRDALHGISHTVEFMLRHRDGQEMWLSSTMVPWVESDGVKDIYTISKDITSRKQAEYDLLHTKQELEEALRVKGDFLAMMSHELRTPLNGVLGMSDVLLEMDLNEEQKEFVGHIHHSGTVLLHVINEVLDYSKLEAGKMSLAREPFSIRQLLEETSGLFSTQVRQKNLELDFSSDDSIPDVVLGDEQRIRQVLINLISNAVKFTFEGGIRMGVHAAPAASDAAEEPVWQFNFTVQDTGIGISEEDQQRLFQPFYQIDSKINRTYEGTGLGLAICKNLIELMDGEIGVRSAEGKGSLFYFIIPMKRYEDQHHDLLWAENLG
ncbi:MHYT domain-containing protein [Paenibacillus bovis]|uniref:Circadian input-output histidine kinase CikA n=1 Tax=Paenibacillus bovis TaxID=1616788 RepID=A0A172ZCK9_9BACL|nr:MHYT domain-containing protein [Paenibacillus bovis]ANF95243.1 PAS domain S-box protein [Paenibacillus bovis]